MNNTTTEFQTHKQALDQSRIVNVTPPNALNANEVLLKIDRFAYTANNITYGLLGEQLGYWDFFPAQGDDAEDWGLIPVWGFADVIESQSADIPVGERLYGYFPPSEYLKIVAGHIKPNTVSDISPHRAHLAPAYNTYSRVLAEPNYDRHQDSVRMLLYPLHITSFALNDMLKTNHWFEAKQIIIISASSKTSTGLAYGLQDEANAPKVIGLTSNRNSRALKTWGVYDEVYTYDDIDQIDASVATVIVDMSADANVISQLHIHLGDNMRFCSNVGLTHWDQPKTAEGIISERSQMFFAPGYLQQYIKTHGLEHFATASQAFIFNTATKSSAWLKITELDGTKALAEHYSDVCQGKLSPDTGLIIKL